MNYIIEEVLNDIEFEDAWDQIDYVLTDYSQTTNEELLEILKSGQEYDPCAIKTALLRTCNVSYEQFETIEAAYETAIDLLEPDTNEWTSEKVHYAKLMIEHTHGNMPVEEALYLIESVKRLSDSNVRLLEGETCFSESYHEHRFERLSDRLAKYDLKICQGWIRYQIGYIANEAGAIDVLAYC